MLTQEQISRFHTLYRQDRNAKALTAAMAGTDINDLAFIPVNAAKLNGAFEVEVKTHGITAQQKSGRCWLFAAMNILREEVIKKTGLGNGHPGSGKALRRPHDGIYPERLSRRRLLGYGCRSCPQVRRRASERHAGILSVHPHGQSRTHGSCGKWFAAARTLLPARRKCWQNSSA